MPTPTQNEALKCVVENEMKEREKTRNLKPLSVIRVFDGGVPKKFPLFLEDSISRTFDFQRQRNETVWAALGVVREQTTNTR